MNTLIVVLITVSYLMFCLAVACVMISRAAVDDDGGPGQLAELNPTILRRLK